MGKKKNKRMNDMDNENFEHVEEQSSSSGSERYDYPVAYPQKFSPEILTSMDDEDLHNVGRSLADAIHRVGRMNLNPYPWEIEMCYLQQEIQMRQTRRAAHFAWLNKTPMAANVVEESEELTELR